jgi:hypothetical protein
VEGQLANENRVKSAKPSYMGCSEIQLNLPGALHSLDTIQLMEWQLEVLCLVDVMRRRAGCRLVGTLQISQSMQVKVGGEVERGDW